MLVHVHAALLSCALLAVQLTEGEPAAVDREVDARDEPAPAADEAAAVGWSADDATPREAPALPPGEAPVPPRAERTATWVPVRGRVLARGTRRPLFGAALLVGTESLGETDEVGRFAIELPPGAHRLLVQSPGYEPESVTVEVGTTPIALVLRLTPRQTGERFETVVVAPEKQAERIALREEELTRTPGSLGDPLRVIESLPGVAQVVWPLAMYNVRGANPGNTGMFLDGVRLPALYHFALGPSVIHPFLIEQVDFYPGGYPARFGRFVSGIVSAQTQSPQVDRAHVSADLRLFDVGGIVAVPLSQGRTQIALAGRYSYSGYLLSRLAPGFNLAYWDYQLRVEHRTDHGRLTLFAFGSGDVLEREGATSGRTVVDPINAKLRFHRVSLDWRAPLGKGRLNAGLVAGHDRSESFIPQVNNLPVGVASVLGVARVGYLLPLGPTLELETGVDAEAQHLDPDRVAIALPEQDILRRRGAFMGGAFVALAWQPRPWLLLSPGARLDYFAEEGTTRLAPGPRLNARARLGEAVWLKGSLGRFAQMPSLPVAVPGFESFGLRSLGLQSSTQGSLGVEAGLGDQATAEATGFLQRMDVTDLSSIFNYDVQAPLLQMRPGRAYGVEVMLRRPARHRLHGWLAYTLSRSERALPPYWERVASDWDQRHILNLVASWRLGGGYQVGGRFRYNTGRPYPVFNKRSLIEDVQAVEYSKLPDFHQLDFRFDRRWVFDAYVLDAYVELINATLTEQVFDIKIRNDGSVERVGFRAALPSIGLHVEW